MRAASQSTWQLIQSYGTSATYNWNSTGAAAGIVYFGVWVKDATSTTTTFDSNASMPFTVGSPCASASVSALPTSVGEGSGTHSTISGVATGCANSAPLYEFWLRTATSAWILVRSYTTAATYDWNSTGAPAGTIYFGLWVKDATSGTTTFDANASTTVTVTPAVCTGVTASALPTAVTGGVHSVITGAATGCSNASPLYEFWLRTSTSGWILVRSYSTAATYDWNSAGAPVGTIYFGVWAKDAKSSTATFDANASTTVTVS
jgi:nicotinamide mononucleotide (NMN) deamidase PncC